METMNKTPNIEAHLKGHDEPTHYAVFHDGRFVANLDPDALIGFFLAAARSGVGPTPPSVEWTETLIKLFNNLADIDRERALASLPESDENQPF